MIITSKTNSLIKHISALGGRAYREKCGEFVVEGRRAVEEAIKAGADISLILVREDYEGPVPERKVVFASPAAFDKAAGTVTPQGILAVCMMRVFDVSSLESKSVIICDNVRDPGNIGGIIRTAHAFGAGVVLTKGCADAFAPKVVRATMSSIFSVKVVRVEDTGFVDFFRERGYRIAAGVPGEGARFTYLADLRGKVAFIVGNEADGVSDELIQKSDIKIKIPMPGGAESLNASVAAGLMLYEHLRQNK